MDDIALADALEHQYRSALTMLRTAIERCPDNTWGARDGEAPFWQQAAHVLFYTHLYLCESDGSPRAIASAEQAMARLGHPMKSWSGPEVRRLSESMAGLMDLESRPFRVPGRGELLGLVDECEEALAEVAGRVASGGAMEGSPMSWMTGSVLDLLLYNLRHAQHHIGRLHAILGRRGIRVRWIG